MSHTSVMLKWMFPLLGVALACGVAPGQPPGSERAQATLRVATYNAALNRDEEGALVRDLKGGRNEQAKKIAEVIQRVRPDVLLLNEFDYDVAGRAAELFCSEYLAVGQNGCEPIEYHPNWFSAPVNTGRPSGRDLDKDGWPGGPADAIGFGRHEGQYGMLVLSKYPIDRTAVRTFQNFLWCDMPGALLPVEPGFGLAFYDEEDLDVLRLSSKSFWDVPIECPGFGSAKLHLLCSHPTPPVFDGPEDRNGQRNHDEVRMVADYITPDRGAYLVDDAGGQGPLGGDELFVIVGDLNCDPVDGQGVPGTMDLLLKHPRVESSFVPQSAGGARVAKQFADQNSGHRGAPENVTCDFTGEGHGNLRIDYVLPSRGLEVKGGGVFWPTPDEPGGEAVTASDHRMVWLDLVHRP